MSQESEEGNFMLRDGPQMGVVGMDGNSGLSLVLFVKGMRFVESFSMVFPSLIPVEIL